MNKPKPDSKSVKAVSEPVAAGYEHLLGGIDLLIATARSFAARAANAVMTATYWDAGRQIVEFEQGGRARAAYGAALLERLSTDLTTKHGRGFSVDNLERFRLLYLRFPLPEISATPLRISESPIRKAEVPTLSGRISATPLRKSDPALLAWIETLASRLPLSWSHYTRLIRLKSNEAFTFYHAEALRGGWTIKQLDRQIGSGFYERAILSKNKAAMLTKGGKAQPDDAITPDEQIRDPLVLEFLNLRDEYSETDLENALIRHLETFLMELGGDFAFIGRQRRLRIGSEWYRVDLLFFHRRLRCLIVIDLKLGKFTHADAGQMHLYLNYAREHWTHDGENPPVGLILCAEKDESVAKYALENLGSKVLAREYQMLLPNEKLLAAELEKTRHQLESRT
ncbi:MAG: PDDEXK nuclease domain-containing protein [Verrucomicrobia bacterium]|nr:PDDEXK nuclease domain-containing protein [Verrucomicrobiota bacterium]